jgi:hypothetical protein
MNPSFILYGTLGCHLCDQAESIVLPLARAVGVNIVLVDIAGDDSLETRYAVRIPVLSNGNQELEWPFDHATVSRFLLDNA